MNHLFDGIRHDLIDPRTALGAVIWAVVFLGIATVLAVLIRRSARRLEPRLSDVTGLRFATLMAQLLTYLGGIILYAHLIPELRAMGTALLAGVSVVSIVLGIAAQNTLGNLVAGMSLVLYRPVRVGDRVRLSVPPGLSLATVEFISLGYTLLRDTEGNDIIVPNSVMVSTVMIRPKPGDQEA